MTTESPEWCNDVLHFWFSELTEKDWFMASSELDTTIKERFSEVHSLVSSQTDMPADATPRWGLAAVIVLDQFSRNMFRGSKDAFASDPLSLEFSKQAVARELHQSLSDDEKQFLFMPYMHSENLSDQKTSVMLFTELGRPEHAVEHMAIVEKFGRFPHRNDVLGRESTAAEIDYLKNAKRFGQ